MTQADSSIAERLLTGLEKVLRERNHPEGVVQRGLRLLQSGLKLGSTAYFFALIVLLVLIDWLGERVWLLTPILYLPPQVWLLPLAVLTPLCLFFNWKLCKWHAAAVVWLFFVHLDFHWSVWHPPASPSLKIMTVNMGQRKARALLEFVRTENPDVIAFQEGGWTSARALAGSEPAYYIATEDEFTLASQYPIKRSGPVRGGWFGPKPVAARFELDFHGRTVVVDGVHLPTPRPEFYRLRGRGFLVELFGGRGIYSSDVRRIYATYWRERIELARGLINAFQREPQPFLVVGDFNMPDHGYIYDLFNKQLTDVFAAKGRGYGLTFPGVTRNPLTLFGPWLRLDYIFADEHWRPVECRVEPRQRAQHRATVATLELKEAK